MKYWNGFCWRDHHEDFDDDSPEYRKARELFYDSEQRPINVNHVSISPHTGDPRQRLQPCPDCNGSEDGTRWCVCVPPRCDFSKCVDELGHDGNHRDMNGQRLYASIEPQTEAQKKERKLGPIKIDAAPDDRRDNPLPDYLGIQRAKDRELGEAIAKTYQTEECCPLAGTHHSFCVDGDKP